jgi:hypothetical protein
MSGRC